MNKTQKAFLMLEIVFAILLVGVAFGIFAHFYTQNTQLKQNMIISDSTQAEVIHDIRELTDPLLLTITSTDGKFCEGELFEIQKGDGVFKIFNPKNCDK